MAKRKKAKVRSNINLRPVSVRRVPTPDDWYPTAKDGCVTVRIYDWSNADEPMIRTCVWGEDDCGMERDEKFLTSSDARQTLERRIREVSQWGIITKQGLLGQGFGPA